MKVNLLLITVVFFQIGNTLKAQEEKQVLFYSNEIKLKGYLTIPKNEKLFPVVIVSHSASHGHHDFELYNHLEEKLSGIGIGVFTYDRRGSGESEGNANNSNLEELSQDLIAAIKAVKNLNQVDTTKIGLFGISQGGWIAPLAYSLNPEVCDFMILISSCGVTPAQQMEFSAIKSLQLEGYNSGVIDSAKYLRRITNEYYRGKKERVETQKIIDVSRQRPWFDFIYLPWQGNLPKDVTTTRWSLEMDFNPEPIFRKVKIPVLLIYGEFDRWVPIEKSINIWKSCFQESNYYDFTIKRIKDSGHMMIINEDKEYSQGEISGEYGALLLRWLKNRIIDNK